MVEKNLKWHTILSINIEYHFIKHEEDISNPTFDNLGQPRVMKVCEPFATFNLWEFLSLMSND